MGDEMGSGGVLGIKAVAMTFLPGLSIAGGSGGSSWIKGVLSDVLRMKAEGSTVRPKKQSIVNT
jgi:hypothetical protein